MNLEQQQIIKSNKSRHFGCKPEIFSIEGTSFRVEEDYATHNELELELIFKRHFITAGQQTVDLLIEKSDNGKQGLTLEFLKSISKGSNEVDPCVNMALHPEKAPEFPLAEGYVIKSVAPSDRPPLEQFINNCREEDLDEAMIDLDDPDNEILLIYKGDTPVGYAGYRIWDGDVGDVGILIHHEHRKKGLGCVAVALITNSCLKSGYLPLYRASKENVGSVALGEKVGYRTLWESWDCIMSL